MTVLVVGDAGLDVLAKHDGPVVPGGDRRADIRTTLGGAGANTAAWLAHLGARTVLVGRIGDDPAGRQVRTELATAGVRCALTVDYNDAATCCVVVLVDEHGQRTMLADRLTRSSHTLLGAEVHDDRSASSLIFGADGSAGQ